MKLQPRIFCLWTDKNILSENAYQKRSENNMKKTGKTLPSYERYKNETIRQKFIGNYSKADILYNQIWRPTDITNKELTISEIEFGSNKPLSSPKKINKNLSNNF